MVKLNGPDENGGTLVLEPDTVEANPAAVEAVVAAILKDAATDATQYLEDTEVPGGGE